MKRYPFNKTVIVFATILSLLITAVGITTAQEPSAQLALNCPGAPASRLSSGIQARVTPGLPNILRSQPGRTPGSVIVGEIPGNGIFTVLNGYAPQCYEGRLWWYVSYNGLVGWTPEAEVNGPYWTEPLGIVPPVTPIPTVCQPTRLTPGGQGQVALGSANALRSLPRRGPGSQIYLYIPSQGVFTVLTGQPATCTDGVLWHYVSYNGVWGWTPESNATQYWVSPYTGGQQPPTCNNGLPNRLIVGRTGRVTPGLPNSLRSQPSIYSSRLGYIYPGEAVSILAGPVCDNGIPYYQVQTVNGTIGWTGEGRWGQYWIDPV